ncbi:anti-sigma factor RsbA family regulatory protein [Streptomyces cinereoruber]|uniref:anti-sigma factor RsbA family regulatory protein n=1 Tax=Streptomyces cinereoruber TaxID=67260 RepID=UPI003C300FDC
MTSVTTSDAFVHPALFYRTEREYIQQTLAFLKEGLAQHEPMAVAVPGPNLELIKTALGADGEGILFLDMTEVGLNPGRIIPRVLRGFADGHPEGRVRIIGEPIWAGRSETEYPACAQHEALINVAFEGRAVTILCPYDETALEPEVLADARITHPLVIDGDGQQKESDVYDWRAIADRYNQPLVRPEHAPAFSYGRQDLPEVRRFAVARAVDLGLTEERLEDLELSVAELTTNSVVHGGGRGTLAVWAEHSRLVCEVHDGGRLSDSLAGRRPPEPGQIGGRGLMLVHYVMDLVRLHTTAEGTTVRFYLDL